jgi:hypothetical protein
MPKLKLIRGITLLFFVSLMTAFVLYRAGKFDSYLSGDESEIPESEIPTSLNGGSVATVPIDTIPRPTRRTEEKTILPSSKSMTALSFSEKPTITTYVFFDSVKIKKAIDSINKAKDKRIKMMSSSKSTYVLSADDIFFMPSSKYGPVFTPPKIQPPLLKINRDTVRLRLNADSLTQTKR